MWLWIHKLSSAPYAYRMLGRLRPWLLWLSVPMMIIAAIGGLWLVPIDYQQKEAFRIFYVHVPIAALSLGIYMWMAFAAAIGLIWRMKLAFAVAAAAAPIGASFTVLSLVTGSIWGRPMWGTWWTWDVRVTTEVILLFLYMGYIALRNSFDDVSRGDRTSAVLAIAGSVDVPIVKYSVIWWNSLHQGSTVLKFARPSMDSSMLWPFLVMLPAVTMYVGAVLCVRVQTEILKRERKAQWLHDYIRLSEGDSAGSREMPAPSKQSP
jgi:heme exporter protein C